METGFAKASLTVCDDSIMMSVTVCNGSLSKYLLQFVMETGIAKVSVTVCGGVSIFTLIYFNTPFRSCFRKFYPNHNL